MHSIVLQMIRARAATRLLGLILTGIVCFRTNAQSAPADVGKAAADQLENDWVDARWNQTEVGSFLASSLKTPGGQVAKALSIRVGHQGEGSVCFDTGAPTLRAAWVGGFLKFDPARYGLIRPPTASGDWNFVASEGTGWQEVSARHEAMHLNGRRVVLDTRVGETLVRQTPWYESSGTARAFTLGIQAASHKAALRLRIWKGSKLHLETRGDLQLASMTQGGNTMLIALRGGPASKLRSGDEALDMVFAPSDQAGRAKLFFWSSSDADEAAFEKLALASPLTEDLEEMSRPGPARWVPALTTKGQTGFPTDGFAIDTLTVPYANPWNALFFCSGVDFFSDGSAAVCTIHGDVWRVSGIDARLGSLTWKRYATGLFQPLGLRVVNDKVYVLGRDQITRLEDENGDGEADQYENFFNRINTKPGHDYVACLERDSAGSFYFVDPDGVHRVSADGKQDELLAKGLRNPNGLGVSSDGIITATPQQGNWTPSSAIVEVKHGGYYGYGGPRVTADRPFGYDPMLCWLPHVFDNSSSSEVWVPRGKWGALEGQMLHFAWGRCGLILVLRDAENAVPQGAAVALPGRFLSGPMRGTFNPGDGALYVACSRGWQTSAAKDGALQRVRHTGAKARVPMAWRAYGNGLTLTFAQPLDPATAGDAGSFVVHQWNYRYASEYGSKDYSVSQPAHEGRDEVEVRSAKLLPDGRTVFLEMPGLKPVMQMEVKYNVNFSGGQSAAGPVYLTINQLGAPLL